MIIARFLFTLTFLISGVSKVFTWNSSVEDLMGRLYQWQTHLDGVSLHGELLRFCIPIAPVLLGSAILLEVIGGGLILFGIKTRLGAFFLLLFLVPSTLVCHAFWLEIGEGFQQQLVLFLQNISIIGALLYLLLSPHTKKSSTQE